MTSTRILTGWTVERDANGTLSVEVGEHTISFTADDLRSMLAYAETGQEPAESEGEKASREGKEDFAKFLDSLILPENSK